MNANKLIIGSANFGLQYGVKNQRQISAPEVSAILSVCRQNRVNFIDTAVGYGESQQVLGACGVQEFNITTKLPALPEEDVDVSAWVYQHLEQVFAELQTQHLYGLFLHRPNDLLGPRGEALARALTAVRETLNIDKIGISVYEPRELLACRKVLPYDLVQVPCNAFDQRFCQPAIVEFFEAHAIEVHARSLFLQGLLVMDPSNRPPYFDPWHPTFATWEQTAAQFGVSKLGVCLAFAEEQSFVSRWVIGIDEPRQLAEILEPSDACLRVEKAAWSPFANLPLELISPARWSIQ